ncbi:sodium/glutamate symporter [Lentibacillus amyloliquefaciens]|uniref:Sodium:glutamate symporter n=1 Tax=Lentibacillus amyloliquefaciens TaxID=1472767 RepID=A0A0U4F5G3_9BACI|nr:sodium/glutamate symporter [Lentibacillus amyloliquefaciens]ALX48838.1 sodium:glutamate symporter [Lentibacillus amyloliquefaciens]
MTPNQIGFALLYLGLFLIIGKSIRIRVKWMQNLFLPSSVIGGFLALILGPQVLGSIMENVTGEDSFWATGLLTPEIMNVWTPLAGLMINVVFATLFLGTVLPSLKKVWNIGGPQLAFGWTLGWGQYVFGLLLAILILVPFYDMPPFVGALIEIGFEGGHGTAAGLQGTFEDLGFAEAYDLAIGLATVGILSGVIIGIAAINWAVRKNHAKTISDVKDASELKRAGIVEFENRDAAAKMTVRPESIEPLSLHFAMIGIAILVGYVLLEGITWLEQAIIGSDFMTYVPLFPLAMIGGIIVQLIASKIDKADILDRQMIMRIQGFSLDVLILSAIATVSLDVIGQYLVPFLLLSLVGIIWNVLGLFFIGPRMIPSYWFERGIGDFGQSMGITATGLLLMRVADPEMKSPAYEGFGYKQLVFEPFLGGGLVTALSAPLVFQFGPIPFLIFATVMLAIGLLVGLFYFGRMKS